MAQSPQAGKESHLNLLQEGTWESGFPAGDELGCAHNALCDPSASVSSQRGQQTMALPAGRAFPEGKQPLCWSREI